MGFFNSESGMSGMTLGLATLIVAGVAGGALVQGRFQASSGQAEVRKEVETGVLELQYLRKQLEIAESDWDKGKVRIATQEALETLSAQGKKSASLKGELSLRKRELENEVARLGEEFDDYRAKYRRQVRSAAVGEKLEELASRQGKVYRAVTIRRVTEAGMEITHADGLASLGPEDLADSWRERFQW